VSKCVGNSKYKTNILPLDKKLKHYKKSQSSWPSQSSQHEVKALNLDELFVID